MAQKADTVCNVVLNVSDVSDVQYGANDEEHLDTVAESGRRATKLFTVQRSSFLPDAKIKPTRTLMEDPPLSSSPLQKNLHEQTQSNLCRITRFCNSRGIHFFSRPILVSIGGKKIECGTFSISQTQDPRVPLWERQAIIERGKKE